MTRQDNTLIGYVIITDVLEDRIVKHFDIHDKNIFDSIQKNGLEFNDIFKVEIKEYPKCEDCGDVLHRQQVEIKKKKYCMRCSFAYRADGKLRKVYADLRGIKN